MAGLGLRRVPTQSRREHVAEILRDAITSGRLAPGDRLIELDLAAELGTSRAPVREALRQLEQEGLVVSYPYRGSEVLGVSQDEVEQVLVPIRITLERFAFKKALSTLTPQDLETLQTLVDEMEETARAGAAEELADADIRFHELVITRSEQRHCLQMWKTIQPRVRAYFRRDAPAHSDPAYVARQHQHLLDVIRTGDEAAVLDAVEQHIHIHLEPATEPEGGEHGE
ncbi:GntR family transcriptional regulator [Phytoactinopolyspora alkaliphila]|uniref:GntR family transcriptional regulator n=1 Tax=Phytoactinopolyspora alkaliphila TaxID=1783498 RepID=A0A6N9YQ95_9ACTN|nr:GntR family transcriptional regulator [Phytoactinopolyspora alkaliphila]NED97117.1 GntR family transcriptional regulator [Phytoactinopolyspora alkaliphila]